MNTLFRGSLQLAVLLSFFSPGFAAQAASPVGWTDQGLYGGQINTIVRDPVDPGTMFAGSYYGDGLFKTTDGGDTWHSVDGFRNELVYSIVVGPQNHNIIWVTTAYSIYKSADGGQTWKSSDPALTLGQVRYYYSIAVDPEDSDIAYIGTSGPSGFNSPGRVYKTSDGGETWEKTSLIADHNVWDLAVDRQNPQTIWAVTGPEWVRKGSIYRSRDGGASWSLIHTGLKRGWLYFVVIHPCDSQTVYVGGANGLQRSSDGGITWSQLGPKSWCRAFSFCPDDPNKLYTAWYDLEREESVISKSVDGGETWVTHDLYPLEFISLIVYPGNGQVLYGGDAGLGVFKSIDGGQSWDAVNNGVTANHVYDSAIAFSGNLLAGSQAGVFLRNAAGVWEGLVPFPSRSVAVSPEHQNTLFAGFDWAFGRSTDGGENWSFGFIPSSEANRVSSLAVDHQDPDIIYIGVFYYNGTKGEIYKSTDGGESLNLIKTLPTPVNALTLDPHNPRVIYAGTGMFYGPEMPGGVYKSTDGGETWEEKGLAGSVVNALAIDSNQPSFIYSGCGGASGLFAGLFKTADGGQTWEKKNYGIPEGAAIVGIRIDPANGNVVYAATHRHGIFISHDGGNYWTPLGLSEYWIYDILVSGLPPSASKTSKVSKAELHPSSELYTGTGSGLLAYTGAGTSVITGLLTDANTGLGITGGTISTDTGGTALSLEGAYIMFAPAGICTVSACMDGYQAASQSGVMLAGGSAITVDLSLTPLSPPNMKTIATNLAAPPVAGDRVRIAFTPSAQSEVYYRWYQQAGFGTSHQGEWEMLSDWSKDKKTLTWSPASDNRYLVLGHVAWGANNGNFHQIGLTFETRGSSPNPIQITDIVTTLGDPHSCGTPIILNTRAAGGRGSLYYKYFYRFGTGGWNALGGWNTKSSAVLTPPSPGEYTIMVHVSDDPTVADNSLAQAGMTCTITE